MENNILVTTDNFDNQKQSDFYDEYFKGFESIEEKELNKMFDDRFGHLDMFKKGHHLMNDVTAVDFFHYSKHKKVKTEFLKMGLLTDNDKCTVYYKAHMMFDMKNSIVNKNPDSLKNFFELCERAFQLGTSSIKNYIAIYDYIIMPGKPQNYNEYGYSQLVATLPLHTTCFTRYNSDMPDVSDILDTIKPTLSVRRIKDIVKDYIELRNKKPEEKPTQSKVSIEEEEDETELVASITRSQVLKVFKEAIEKFKYHRQDVNVVSKFVLDKLDINCDIFDFANYSADGVDVVNITPSVNQIDSVNKVVKSFKFDIDDKVYLRYKNGNFVESEVLFISIHSEVIYYNCRKGKNGQQGYKADEVYSEDEKQAIELEESNGSITDYVDVEVQEAV